MARFTPGAARLPPVIEITEREGCVRFNVRVQPRASRNAVEGEHGGALKVRLTAPPVEGAANDALIALLAAELGVARSAIRITSGAGSRSKTVEVDGVGRDLIERLASGDKR